MDSSYTWNTGEKDAAKCVPMSGTAVLPPGSPPPPDPGYEDLCPNIGGVQNPVPSGMVKDGNGNCVAQVCTPSEMRQADQGSGVPPGTSPVNYACNVVIVYHQCDAYGAGFAMRPQTGGWYNSGNDGCDAGGAMPANWCGEANCYGGPFPPY